jgi:hypothetical protein
MTARETSRRITVSESIQVERAPADVFDFTQDYARRGKWDRLVVRTQSLDGGVRRFRIKVRGTGSYTVEYRLFRRGVRTSARFTDVDSSWLAGGGGSWRYTPSGAGTRWIQTNTLELRSRWWLGPARSLVRLALRRSMRRAMSNAKRLMESDATPPPVRLDANRAAA